MNIYKRLVTEPRSVFIRTTLCILAILLALPLTLLSLPLWFAFLLFQRITSAWILYWKTGHILATQDVPFAQGPNTRNFITCLFTLKGNVSVRAVRRAFSTKILQGTHESYVRLKQCVQSRMGRYVRSDEANFDIKKHIFVYEGAPPSTNEELVQCYYELINRDIPSGISPWQIIIIPRGKRAGTKSFVICVRIHHTIGDGYALVGLLAKVVDNKPELLQPDTKRREGAGVSKVLRAIFTAPFVLICIMLTHIENPFKRKKSLGEIKVAWTKPIDLADIKRISKTKFGATINDALTACLAGAIRRYLTSSGVASPPNDLQIAITMNTRMPASLLNGEIPLENNSTGVFFNLPVGALTLAERILETKRRMDLVKGSSEYLLFGFLFKYFMATLPEFVARLSSNTMNKCCCMVLSNVPGPLNKLVLEGNVVESVMVWPPLISDIGVSVAVFSYAGKIRVTVKADSAVISDPTVLIDNFTEEVEDLVRYCE